MKLLAVDSNSILNRAYYGIRPLTTRDGMFTNGIYGFLNILLKLLDETQPDLVAFAFDLPAPTFRHKLFDGYKAGRKGMPEELAMQVAPLKELLTLMGYPILSVEGFEADDILGTLATVCRRENQACVIATGDRDSFQLIGDGVTVRLAFTRGGQSGAELVNEATIVERYGVTPCQMLDVKALMGDPSDNIPGVAGIGEKTALSLIAQFGSLESVYAHLDDCSIKKGVRQRLETDREMALLSHRLAAICCDVPLGLTLNDLARRAIDEAALYRLLDRLELHSLIARMGLVPGEAVATLPIITSEITPPTRVIPVRYNDAAAWEAMLLEPELFAILQLQQGGGEVALLGSNLVLLEKDFSQRKELLCALARYEGTLTLPESKNFYSFGYENNIKIPIVKFDPSLAGYLLSPLSSSYTLDMLCAGRSLQSLSLDLPQALPEEMTSLAANIARLPALCTAMQSELSLNGQDALLRDIELPLARVLASMETFGFSLDVDGLKTYGDELDSDLAQLTNRIYLLAGGEFNLNSPKQLGEVLFDRLGLPTKRKIKTGWSTDADALDSLRTHHPIVEDILAYRKLSKLKSTYVDGLLSKVAPDGRVHTSFRQTETRTGRISSTEPNLQNIPIRTERGSLLRRFFVSSPGMTLVDADYSQIELRVLAHISNDPTMIEAFQNGEDIHTKTAAQVFDMPEEFVTPRMRSSAKAVNFGIVYGIGAFSLSQDIGVTVAEADRYIKNYLATYAGVKRYMEETILTAQKSGYVATLFGRRRPLPELAASNRMTHAFGERVAMNTPIQGTAADIIKLAMIRVFDRLAMEGLTARLILQVHDELIVEAPIEEADRAAAIITEEMQNVLPLRVPLLAESSKGYNWLEAK